MVLADLTHWTVPADYCLTAIKQRPTGIALRSAISRRNARTRDTLMVLAYVVGSAATTSNSLTAIVQLATNITLGDT